MSKILSNSTSRSPYSAEQAFNIIQEVIYKEKHKIEGQMPTDDVLKKLIITLQEEDKLINEWSLQQFLVETYKNGWKE